MTNPPYVYTFLGFCFMNGLEGSNGINETVSEANETFNGTVNNANVIANIESEDLPTETLSLEDFSNENTYFSVYNNKINHLLDLFFKETVEEGGYKYAIYDLTGRVVQKENSDYKIVQLLYHLTTPLKFIFLC
jgi:hypothetical protein